MIKLLLVGDPGGGKTSLCARFSNNGFSSKYIATLGVEFMVKTVQAGSRRLKLQIWDTSGQEKFLAITEKHYRLTKAFVIVYDMTDRSSFTHVQKWLASIDRSCPASSLRHLVAAKCDIPDPAVTEEEGRALAQSLGLGFTSCSAKEDKNVEELFLEVAAATCDLVAAEQCLQTPMVITVLASLGEAVHDGIELVGLDLAGTELGKCCVEDMNATCADGLSALRAALNIRQGQVVRFVTQGGVILPTDKERGYEEDPAEVICKLETKEAIDSFEAATESAFKSHGVHREDIDSVDESLTVVDKDGAPVYPRSFVDLSDVDAERYPLTFKFSVKRRRDPKTVVKLFDLDAEAKS